MEQRRRPRGRRFLTLLTLTPAAACTPAPGDVRSLDEGAFARYLDERIPALMEAYDIPGVGILVITGGRPAWSRAYGWADREAGRPLEARTVMMTHSISKSVTAWGVMRLVEEGRIGLDDPLVRHVRSWAPPLSGPAAEEITVRRLLGHTAGMPLGTLGVHHAPGEPLPSLPETLASEVTRPARRPGTSFLYSNLGYAALELLIEEVTGRDFAEYMEAEVLRPLGMLDSSFRWDEARHREVPLGYGWRGDPVPPFVYAYRASGGLFSTLDDLGRFVAAGMAGGGEPGGSVLAPGSVAELHSPQVATSGLYGLVSDAYGLGHYLEAPGTAGRVVWHGGQGAGWMTDFHFLPELGDGIVLLTNSQRSWPFMAHVLNDWARWRGFPPVGMGRIAAAEKGVRVLIGLVLVLVAGRAWAVGRGVVSGRRALGPAGGAAPGPRAVELASGALLLLLLGWAAGQDYLFVTSVFPVRSAWLGLSLLALASVLIASALLPVVRQGGAPRPRRTRRRRGAGQGHGSEGRRHRDA